MQDELLESIRRFSVSDDPLSTTTAQTFVDAFAPLSHATSVERDAPSPSQTASTAISKVRQARSTALLSLASRSSSANASVVKDSLKPGTSDHKFVDENLPQLLTPVIRSRLADTTPYSLLSALHFFSALFSVLPTEAHDILAADGILDLVLEAPDACNAVLQTSSQDKRSFQLPSDEDFVSLAVAELLSFAANSTATRKYLASQQAALDWIDMAGVSRNTHSSGSHASPRKSDAIAVVAGLADIKIYRAISAEAAEGLTQAASSTPTSQEDHIRKIQQTRSERRHKDELIYQIAKRELLETTVQRPTSTPSSAIQEATRAELRRTLQLSCLEVLAYLTVQPMFKERVAGDRELLRALCTAFDVASPKSTNDSPALDVNSQRFDGALQLSLATILSNVTAYPPSLTSEEKQVRRLRIFANAQNTKQTGGSQADQDEQFESVAHVEKRCTAVLEAKGVEALAAIAVAGSPSSTSRSDKPDTPSWKINPSQSVRRACGEALLALVTKQDRMARGKAVQQGALKASLALATPVLHNLASASSSTLASEQALFSRSNQASRVSAEDLAPLQALAKLLISLNPSLLFPSTEGLLSVAPCICSLLFCESASRLQKFEALLALTNLASISPQIGLRIASFSLDQHAKKEGDNQAEAVAFSNTSVIAQAGEQLFMEEHTMVRRAWIELLVNLLQVQDVFEYFVSASGTSDPQGRLSMRLRMLLGLSEVDDWAYTQQADAGADGPKADSKDSSGEASLGTRMACLAILAMATESRVVVDALLTLDRLFPVLLANLVLDRSDDLERNQWERADLQPANANQMRGDADIEAHVHLNAINLSMRASYVLFNVLQHVQANAATSEPRAGGFDKDAVQSTLQDVLGYHVSELKKGAEPAHVEEARKDLLQVMAECLKAVRQL